MLTTQGGGGRGGGIPLLLPVNLAAPDLRPWIAGNTGIPGVWSFASGVEGPHAVIVALMHGNEIAGALLFDRWLRDPPRPLRGRLTLVLANIEAGRRFDPSDPTATRFLDEDMNRVWDLATLEGTRRSAELRRARELRPVFDGADAVVDLHSMLWPSDPLILAGEAPRAAEFGLAIGAPPLVVADQGHAVGRRLIDYRRFTEPGGRAAAVLVEAGSHWEQATVAMMAESAGRMLRHLGMMVLPLGAAPASPPRLARVTQTITAASQGFAFVRDFRGGEVVKRRNTLIALDGTDEVRTPHDDCLLVMPTPLTPRGHTAVRLARFAER